MSGKPLVSVIIPTYNRKHFIADAIDSCLSQSYEDIEIIVVDDGSRDGTEAHIRDTYGDLVRLIVQVNQGPGIARNRGIAEASGEFIHFLDADDQLHKQKIEVGVDLFRRHPDVSVIYSHYQFVARDGSTLIDTPSFEQFQGDVFCQLLRQTGCHILISSSMYRAAALREIDGFADDPDFRSAEDWDLFLRLATKFRFHGIDRKLVYRRIHTEMMSDDRLYGALGRLKTVQNARGYGWERCMAPDEYDQKEASRHHVYALYLWAAGDRRAAREQFLRAAEIYQPSSLQRRLFALYTWLLPPASIDWTVGLARLLRKLR